MQFALIVLDIKYAHAVSSENYYSPGSREEPRSMVTAKRLTFIYEAQERGKNYFYVFLRGQKFRKSYKEQNSRREKITYLLMSHRIIQIISY